MQKDLTVDFVGVGFPRCGTTWLGRCLSEHPGICFSHPKEAHYFDLDYHYEKGTPFYSQHFSHKTEGQVVGEFTPEYIREPEKCAERIKNDFPAAKLIVVMRDPVMRTFSHYGYRKYKSGTYKSFSEVIENKETDPIVDESVYIKKLQPFLDRFEKENILFLIHEESESNPLQYVQRVYDFLGVDKNYVPESLKTKINTTNNQGMRFPKIERWVNNLRWKVRGNSLGRAILKPLRLIGFTKLITYLRIKNQVPIKKVEKISKEDYDKLSDYFRTSNETLVSTTGVDVSKWKYNGKLNDN